MEGLCSRSHKKKKDSVEKLAKAVITDPGGVLRDFMGYICDKKWDMAYKFLNTNPGGILKVILKRRILPAEEKVLRIIGYASYIPKLRKFWNAYDRLELLMNEGVDVSGEHAYSILISGKIDDALKAIYQELERGKMLRERHIGRGSPHNVAVDNEQIIRNPIPETVRNQLKDRYEIYEIIGGGKFSDVYRARDVSTGRIVAIKVINPWDEKTDRIFMKEVAIWHYMWRMNQRDVAHIYDYHAYPFGYIVMELLEPVENIGVPMYYEEAGRIMFYIGRALYTAHKEGIYHMDVKPSNIFIDEYGHPKLGDWGLAQKKIRGEVECLGGTTHFAPPEILRGDIDAIDQRSDIFSWGATFYYLLTGMYPYPGKNAVEVLKNMESGYIVKNSSDVVDDVPEEIDNIIMKCINIKKVERYQGMGQILVELGKLLNLEMNLSVGESTMLYSEIIENYVRLKDYKKVKNNLRWAISHVKTESLRVEIENCLKEMEMVDEQSFAHNDGLQKRIMQIVERLRRGE